MKLPPLLQGFMPTTTASGADGSLVIPVQKRQILLAQQSSQVLIHREQAEVFEAVCEQRILLGQWNGVDCEAWQLDPDADLQDGFERIELRGLLDNVPEAEFALAGRAVQLLEWQKSHRFCGSCGQPTKQSDADHALVCEACQLSFYPRISPCVIVVVVKGDYCLLARNKKWPPQWYSALAGFVEPGESAEQALHREVFEEVGIHISNERYIGSQTWPFPGQLMLGYLADYQEGDIVVDDIEIEDAQWWRFDELPRCPAGSTMSGRLISRFVEEARNRHDS